MKETIKVESLWTRESSKWHTYIPGLNYCGFGDTEAEAFADLKLKLNTPKEQI